MTARQFIEWQQDYLRERALAAASIAFSLNMAGEVDLAANCLDSAEMLTMLSGVFSLMASKIDSPVPEPSVN